MYFCKPSVDLLASAKSSTLHPHDSLKYMFCIYWLIIIVQRMGHLLEGMVMFCCTVHSDTIAVVSHLSRRWSSCSIVQWSFMWRSLQTSFLFQCCGDHWPNLAVAYLKKTDKSWENDEWCIKWQSISDLWSICSFQIKKKKSQPQSKFYIFADNCWCFLCSCISSKLTYYLHMEI